MSSKAIVDDFVSQKTLAIVGVSRNAQKFGNGAYRELKAKGYTVYPIHPEAATLEGAPAYKDFASLPEKVGGLVLVVPPAQTEKVVREAAAAGIRRVWMQQGAESQAAIQFCKQNGISEVHGECIMMYAIGTGLHGFHRKLWKWFGKAPKQDMNDTRAFLGDPAGWKDVQVQLSCLQGLWGGWRVFVFGSRDVVVQRVSPVTREQRFKFMLTEAEFQLLMETCIGKDLLCVLPPLRPGRPDEPQVQVMLVNAKGESQTVSKWAGEALESFDAVSRQLFALTDRTKDMLPFYGGPFDWFFPAAGPR